MSQVIFRDRQEIQADDLNNSQAFRDDEQIRLIGDAITNVRQFAGLVVTAASATQVAISPGRLYLGDTGKIFALSAVSTLNLFSYLPLLDERWLAISVIGDEAETDQQPRDMLVDLATGTTEPEIVPMRVDRVVTSYITSGIESPSPQKPGVPTGHTLIAFVRLGTAGVLEIEVGTDLLPRLSDVAVRTTALEAFRDVAAPRISTLGSDLAALAARVNNTDFNAQLRPIAMDLARVKEALSLPDTYAAYAADHFLDEDESQTSHLSYYARVEEGIRFPWAGETEQALTIFNPLTTLVKLASGLCLPSYTDEVRLLTQGYAGDLSLSQYQYQTHEFKVGQISRKRYRYGPTQTYCTNSEWWRTGLYDPATHLLRKGGETWEVLDPDLAGVDHRFVRVRQLWIDEILRPYWYVDTQNFSVGGSQVAQTVLISQHGWLTAVDLYITQAASDGIVHLHICEVERGLPVLDRCLGHGSVNAASLKVYPQATRIQLLSPVFCEAGQRYALVITTAGAHRAATVPGTAYSQGTLFYSTDGAYQQGDLTKDLMFGLVFAKFSASRTVLELNPVSLSNGITDLDLLAEMVTPQSTDLHLEYQLAGMWYPVAPDTADHLLGLPAMLPLRLVFVGSQDLMPGIRLDTSRLRATRPAVTFYHVSAVRTLAAPSSTIDVTVTLEGWDEVKHDCTVTLIVGGQNKTANSVVDRTVDSGVQRTAHFALGAATSSYQIVIVGLSTTALDVFHVAERLDVAI